MYCISFFLKCDFRLGVLFALELDKREGEDKARSNTFSEGEPRGGKSIRPPGVALGVGTGVGVVVRALRGVLECDFLSSSDIEGSRLTPPGLSTLGRCGDG